MDDAGQQIMRFDAFALDLANRRLLRGREEVEIGSRYFDALVLLAGSGGELVTKDRFMAEVWRGIPVTDEALTQCIRSLRKALGDDAANPRFIATVPKHGYRFLAGPSDEEPDAPPRPKLARGGRIAGAATIGGGAAGVIGGAFYGIAGGTGGSGVIAVLAALVGALGVLAGASVGIGMGLLLGEREADWKRLAIGGAIGGLVAGASGQVLARDGIVTLTGIGPGPTTGLIEGAVIGGTTGLAGWLALRATRPSIAALAGAGIGLLSGTAIALAGGRLLGLSLLAMQDRFPAAQIDVARVGHLLGEGGFFMFSILLTTALECAVFTGCVALALSLSKRA